MTRLVLVEGDLGEQEVDALVHEIDGAPAPGAGGEAARDEPPPIRSESDGRGPLEVGGATITDAEAPPTARFVIHAAARPPGGEASEGLVRSALRASLELAERQGCRSLAVPAIGTGSGGLTMQRCAEVSLEEARLFIEGGARLEEIRFVLSGEPAFRIFEMVNDAAKVEAQMRRLKGG
ncbi:MAG: macro domain-containing protein [bacterium]